MTASARAWALPQAVWPLWLAGVVLMLNFLPLVDYSGRLHYAEGGVSPDGPGMLMMALIYTFPIWAGGWLLISACYLVGYRGGGGKVFDFGGRAFWSMLLTALAIIASLLFLSQVLRLEWWRLSRPSFLGWLVASAVYWQYLRAAAVRRSRTSPLRRFPDDA